MTIVKIGGFDKKTAARKSDRGGSIMNLVSELLLNLNYDDKKREYKTKADRNTYDYGYAVYQSLEYDFKYLKSDDFTFGEGLLHTIKK